MAKNKNYRKNYFENSNDVVLIESDRLRRIWFASSIIWRIVDLFFAIGAFTASITVVFLGVSYPSDNKGALLFPIVLLSSVSALLTLTGFACSSGRTSTAYRHAFQILNRAVISNISIDGDTDEKGRDEIKKAMVIGENIVGKTYGVDYELSEKDDQELI